MTTWHDKSTVNPDFPVDFWVYEPAEWPISWHEEIEIVYVLEGVYSIELNCLPYTLRERDILIIGSGEIHWTVPQPQKSRIVVLKFGPPIFNAGLDGENAKTSIHTLLCQSRKLIPEPGESIHSKIETIILEMNHEMESKEPGFRLVMRARVYDLVAAFLREMPAAEPSPKAAKRSMKRLNRLEKVFRYIEQEYKREIPLEDAAREADISVYYFARFFKEVTGKTFARYLMEYRVNKAKWYLANPEAKVTDVAFEMGFNNTTTFNRIFKDITGLTPTEFKKTML